MYLKYHNLHDEIIIIDEVCRLFKGGIKSVLSCVLFKCVTNVKIKNYLLSIIILNI